MEAKKPRPILKKIKTLIQGDNSLKVKTNASGEKSYSKRGRSNDGTAFKLKQKNKNGVSTSVMVKNEKGLFRGKKKEITKATRAEMLSEKGSDFGMNVKTKTITKAPGVFGKRTVKKETKFVKNLKP